MGAWQYVAVLLHVISFLELGEAQAGSMAPAKSMNWDTLLGILVHLYHNPTTRSWAVDGVLWSSYILAMLSFQGKQQLVYVRFFY